MGDTVSAENTTNVLAMPIGKEMIVPNAHAHSPNHGVMLLTDTMQLTTMLNALLKESASSTSIGDFFMNTGAKVDKGVIAGANSYGLWDAKKTRACACDPGFSGIDCASMMSPRGDDPLTTEDANGVTEIYDIQSVVISTAATDRDYAQLSKTTDPSDANYDATKSGRSNQGS